MTSHVIAYRSLELLFGTHTFNFNCFFDDFNCVFTQIRCLSRVLKKGNIISYFGCGFVISCFVTVITYLQGSKIALIRSDLRVPQAVGLENIESPDAG